MRLGNIARYLVAVLLIGASTAPLGRASDDGKLVYVPRSTKKVCQLTGDFDRQRDAPTLSRTIERAGVSGTDLGSSFELGDRLFFLFGDTFGRPGNLDAIAWTASTDPAKIDLRFVMAEDGKWQPPKVSGIGQGGFEVPTHGVAIGEKMYVVFTTDHVPGKVTMGRSVLAVSADQGKTFSRLYDLSTDKFINLALWKSGEWLYLFGSGKYRASSVCLARMPLQHIERKEHLQYCTGTGNDGQPVWSAKEDEAAGLFEHNVVGELSVAFLKPVDRYVMLYNSTNPRGIVMRSARKPWGPWSDLTIVFQPWLDQGYGHFMHRPSLFWSTGDSLHDPDRSDVWGGEYGPFIMARYTTPTPDGCRIFYTMSVWNPYQVVVMQSDLRRGLSTAPSSEGTSGKPDR